MRTVDLLFFMGQSNMAGRGEAALAPVVAPGMGTNTAPSPTPTHCTRWKNPSV